MSIATRFLINDLDYISNAFWLPISCLENDSNARWFSQNGLTNYSIL